MVPDEKLLPFFAFCGGVVLLVWGVVFRIGTGEGRFTLRALMALILMESLLFWAVWLWRSRLP